MNKLQDNILATFRRDLRSRLNELVRIANEQEQPLPLGLQIRRFSSLNCPRELVEAAINEVVSEMDAEILVSKAWHSFFWHCHIEITAINCENKIVLVE